MVSNVFFLPTSQDTIQEEDRIFREMLEANGYDVTTMGTHNKEEPSETSQVVMQKEENEKPEPEASPVVS